MHVSFSSIKTICVKVIVAPYCTLHNHVCAYVSFGPKGRDLSHLTINEASCIHSECSCTEEAFLVNGILVPSSNPTPYIQMINAF